MFMDYNTSFTKVHLCSSVFSDALYTPINLTEVFVSKKDSDDTSILILACIYEYCRFHKWKEGPRLRKVMELLQTVYSRNVTLGEIGVIVSSFGHFSILKFKQRELFLTNLGRTTFNEIKSDIIPPQTVAQPQRKRV